MLPALFVFRTKKILNFSKMSLLMEVVDFYRCVLKLHLMHTSELCGAVFLTVLRYMKKHTTLPEGLIGPGLILGGLERELNCSAFFGNSFQPSGQREC